MTLVATPQRERRKSARILSVHITRARLLERGEEGKGRREEKDKGHRAERWSEEKDRVREKRIEK